MELCGSTRKDTTPARSTDEAQEYLHGVNLPVACDCTWRHVYVAVELSLEMDDIIGVTVEIKLRQLDSSK